jgi:hypothetical protein
MLTLDERRLLHWMARDVWEGWGAIVDAGCFLGGSTASLATGVRARPGYEPGLRLGPPLSTYDRFVVEEYTVDAGYFDPWPDVGVSDSFRHIFDELLGDLATETTVHEGDITAARWTGAPIEILFLDVLKNWDVNDAVMREFLPSLVPARSVIVQQDYVHVWLPWIHITMELLQDAVEHIVDVASSRVYAVTSDITRERLDEILGLRQRFTVAEQERLLDAAIARTSGDTTGFLMLSKVNLLRHQSQFSRAEGLLEQVEGSFGHIPDLAAEAHATRTLLSERSGI